MVVHPRGHDFDRALNGGLAPHGIRLRRRLGRLAPLARVECERLAGRRSRDLVDSQRMDLDASLFALLPGDRAGRGAVIRPFNQVQEANFAGNSRSAVAGNKHASAHRATLSAGSRRRRVRGINGSEGPAFGILERWTVGVQQIPFV